MDSPNYVQESYSSLVPPPPMPTNNHTNKEPCDQPRISNISVTAPVWFEEIQKKGIFSKIRNEPGDRTNMDSEFEVEEIQACKQKLEPLVIHVPAISFI